MEQHEGLGWLGRWPGLRMRGSQLLAAGAAIVLAALPLAAAPLEVITRSEVPADVGAAESWTSYHYRFASADGRFVVFQSAAANLVSGLVDDNGRVDVFLRDTETGVTQLVSRNAAGTVPAVGDSIDPVISADGSTVLFQSDATDLVAGQSGAVDNLFVWYRPTGELQMASSLPGTTNEGCGCWASETRGRAMSADGRYVVFVPSATLTAGDPAPPGQVYRFDRVTGERLLVSHVAGDPMRGGNDSSSRVAVSADGQVVVFSSGATDLVAGVTDTAGTLDLFVWSSALGASQLLSHAAGAPTVAVGSSAGWSGPQVSDDGRWVLFSSRAPDLLPGLTAASPGQNDLYLRDRQTNTLQLVSHVAGDPLARAGFGGFGGEHALSGNGRFVAFPSSGTGLVAGQVGPMPGLGVGMYRWDRDTDTTVLVSHRPGAPTTVAESWVFRPRISDDGRWVSFVGTGNDLVAGSSGPDGGWLFGGEVYLFDGATGDLMLVSALEGAAPVHGLSRAISQSLSASGERLTFASQAGRLDPGAQDPSGVGNIFQYRHSDGTVQLVSRRAPELIPKAAVGSLYGCWNCAQVGPGGDRIAFWSSAADLVAESYILWVYGTASFHLDRRADAMTLLDRTAPTSVWWPYAIGAGFGPVRLAGDGKVLFASEDQELMDGQEVVEGAGRNWYLADLATGERTLISHLEGDPLRADGTWARVVAVAADGSAAVALQEAPTGDVVLFDLAAGTRRDLAVGTAMPEGSDIAPIDISADGRFVLFLSAQLDLVPGQQDVAWSTDAFVYDRALDRYTLVSHVAGEPLRAAGGVSEAVLADDGSHVAFVSTAADLVAGQVDGAGSADAFLASLADGKSELVSHRGDRLTAVGEGAPGELAIDGEGRHVAWVSAATSVIPGAVDDNGERDVFRYRRRTRSNELISHRADAPLIAANGWSIQPVLARDGETLAFVSTSDDLVAGQIDGNGSSDVFVFEGRREQTRLASFAGDPLRAGRAEAHSPALSPEGGVLVFASRSPLVAGDYNTDDDLYLMRVVELYLEPSLPAELAEPAEVAQVYLRASHLPSGAVHVALRSTTPSACFVTPAEVVLDAGNWAQGVAVTVSVVDDDVIDGPEPCRLEIDPATGDDHNLVGFDLADVTLIVQDDDASGDALLSDDFEDGSTFAWAE